MVDLAILMCKDVSLANNLPPGYLRVVSHIRPGYPASRLADNFDTYVYE